MKTKDIELKNLTEEEYEQYKKYNEYEEYQLYKKNELRENNSNNDFKIIENENIDLLDYDNNLSDDIANDFKKIVSKYPVLSSEEINELIKDYKETKNQESYNKIIYSNFRLIFYVINKYFRIATKTVPIMDMIQDGSIGLMTAIDKFDFSKETQFSTYAIFWVRSKISRGLANTERIIRLPVHYYDYYIKYNQFINKYESEFLEKPSDEEIEKGTGLNKSIFKYFQENFVSLDKQVSKDAENNTTLGELISNNDESIENIIERKILKQSLLDSFDDFLSEKEKNVILKRYGFYDKIYTLQEIAEEYNVTKERIRQIEKNAIRKIKNPKRIKQIKRIMFEDMEDNYV